MADILYHAFFFPENDAKGGLGDYIASYRDLALAKKAVETAIESSTYGYYGAASDEIVCLHRDKLKTHVYFTCLLRGNVDACKIWRPFAVWAKSKNTAHKQLQKLMEEKKVYRR